MRSDYLILPSRFSGQARRIVSEDSLCRVVALATTVHLLPKEQDLLVVGVRHGLLSEQLRSLCEELEVVSLRTHERKASKERHDACLDIREAIDLPVPATIAGLPHAPASESLGEQIEWCSIDLRHVEGCREFPASRVVASTATHDHEAGLSQREPGYEIPERLGNVCDREPFLLIVRTRHIVTVPPLPDGTSSAGYSDVPAYSRVL